MLQRFLKTGMVLAMLPLMISCGSNEGTSSEEIDNMQESGGMPEANDIHAPGAKLDPVCEMEKDETWTDYSVHQGDTVWFCGAGCKQAFDARPEKYVSAK